MFTLPLTRTHWRMAPLAAIPGLPSSFRKCSQVLSSSYPISLGGSWSGKNYVTQTLSSINKSSVYPTNIFSWRGNPTKTFSRSLIAPYRRFQSTWNKENAAIAAPITALSVVQEKFHTILQELYQNQVAEEKLQSISKSVRWSKVGKRSSRTVGYISGAPHALASLLSLSSVDIAKQICEVYQSSEIPEKLHHEAPRKVIIDYPSPNFGKQLHVGHLRSLAIGESLLRLLRFQGHDVTGHSHVGDFGMPICTMVAYLLQEKQPFRTLSSAELSSLYIQANALSTENEAFRQRAHDICLMLQHQQEEKPDYAPAYEIWKHVCEQSRFHMDILFSELGVSSLERGESWYASRVPGALKTMTQAGVAVKEEDGALICRDEAWESPLVLLKKDSSYTYASADVAAIEYRLCEYGANWLIYVTDSSQCGHFSKIFDVGRKCGWVKDASHRIHHADFGVVQGKDGKRLRSRSQGNDSMPLEELIQLTLEGVRQQFEKESISQDEASLRQLSVACVLYSELSHHRKMPYRLHIENSVSLKGNSFPYLNYAYSRIVSILSKNRTHADEESSEFLSMEEPMNSSHKAKLNLHSFSILHTEERLLAEQLSRFLDVVQEVERQLTPHILCEYLFELATEFHRFYSALRILDGGSQRYTRMQLCIATKHVLHRGMYLLGATPVERM